MSKTTLLQPLKRASGDIASVTVRKPDVGSLRGLKLTDILQMDVTALSRLLPRITEPALLPDEVAALDPADFLGLSAAVVGFLRRRRWWPRRRRIFSATRAAGRSRGSDGRHCRRLPLAAPEHGPDEPGGARPLVGEGPGSVGTPDMSEG